MSSSSSSSISKKDGDKCSLKESNILVKLIGEYTSYLDKNKRKLNNNRRRTDIKILNLIDFCKCADISLQKIAESSIKCSEKCKEVIEEMKKLQKSPMDILSLYFKDYKNKDENGDFNFYISCSMNLLIILNPLFSSSDDKTAKNDTSFLMFLLRSSRKISKIDDETEIYLNLDIDEITNEKIKIIDDILEKKEKLDGRVKQAIKSHIVFIEEVHKKFEEKENERKQHEIKEQQMKNKKISELARNPNRRIFDNHNLVKNNPHFSSSQLNNVRASSINSRSNKSVKDKLSFELDTPLCSYFIRVLKEIVEFKDNVKASLVPGRVLSLQTMLPSRLKENYKWWFDIKDNRINRENYYSSCPKELLQKTSTSSNTKDEKIDNFRKILNFGLTDSIKEFFRRVDYFINTDNHDFMSIIISQSLFLPIFSKKMNNESSSSSSSSNDDNHWQISKEISSTKNSSLTFSDKFFNYRMLSYRIAMITGMPLLELGLCEHFNILCTVSYLYELVRAIKIRIYNIKSTVKHNENEKIPKAMSKILDNLNVEFKEANNSFKKHRLFMIEHWEKNVIQVIISATKNKMKKEYIEKSEINTNQLIKQRFDFLGKKFDIVSGNVKKSCKFEINKRFMEEFISGMIKLSKEIGISDDSIIVEGKTSLLMIKKNKTENMEELSSISLRDRFFPIRDYQSSIKIEYGNTKKTKWGKIFTGQDIDDNRKDILNMISKTTSINEHVSIDNEYNFLMNITSIKNLFRSLVSFEKNSKDYHNNVFVSMMTECEKNGYDWMPSEMIYFIPSEKQDKHHTINLVSQLSIELITRKSYANNIDVDDIIIQKLIKNIENTILECITSFDNNKIDIDIIPVSLLAKYLIKIFTVTKNEMTIKGGICQKIFTNMGKDVSLKKTIENLPEGNPFKIFFVNHPDTNTFIFRNDDDDDDEREILDDESFKILGRLCLCIIQKYNLLHSRSFSNSRIIASIKYIQNSKVILDATENLFSKPGIELNRMRENEVIDLIKRLSLGIGEMLGTHFKACLLKFGCNKAHINMTLLNHDQTTRSSHNNTKKILKLRDPLIQLTMNKLMNDDSSCRKEKFLNFMKGSHVINSPVNPYKIIREKIEFNIYKFLEQCEINSSLLFPTKGEIKNISEIISSTKDNTFDIDMISSFKSISNVEVEYFFKYMGKKKGELLECLLSKDNNINRERIRRVSIFFLFFCFNKNLPQSDINRQCVAESLINNWLNFGLKNSNKLNTKKSIIKKLASDFYIIINKKTKMNNTMKTFNSILRLSLGNRGSVGSGNGDSGRKKYASKISEIDIRKNLCGGIEMYEILSSSSSSSSCTKQGVFPGEYLEKQIIPMLLSLIIVTTGKNHIKKGSEMYKIIYKISSYMSTLENLKSSSSSIGRDNTRMENNGKCSKIYGIIKKHKQNNSSKYVFSERREMPNITKIFNCFQSEIVFDKNVSSSSSSNRSIIKSIKNNNSSHCSGKNKIIDELNILSNLFQYVNFSSSQKFIPNEEEHINSTFVNMISSTLYKRNEIKGMKIKRIGRETERKNEMYFNEDVEKSNDLVNFLEDLVNHIIDSGINQNRVKINMISENLSVSSTSSINGNTNTKINDIEFDMDLIKSQIKNNYKNIMSMSESVFFKKEDHYTIPEHKQSRRMQFFFKYIEMIILDSLNNSSADDNFCLYNKSNRNASRNHNEIKKSVLSYFTRSVGLCAYKSKLAKKIKMHFVKCISIVLCWFRCNFSVSLSMYSNALEKFGSDEIKIITKNGLPLSKKQTRRQKVNKTEISMMKKRKIFIEKLMSYYGDDGIPQGMCFYAPSDSYMKKYLVQDDADIEKLINDCTLSFYSDKGDGKLKKNKDIIREHISMHLRPIDVFLTLSGYQYPIPGRIYILNK